MARHVCQLETNWTRERESERANLFYGRRAICRRRTRPAVALCRVMYLLAVQYTPLCTERKSVFDEIRSPTSTFPVAFGRASFEFMRRSAGDSLCIRGNPLLMLIAAIIIRSASEQRKNSVSFYSLKYCTDSIRNKYRGFPRVMRVYSGCLTLYPTVGYLAMFTKERNRAEAEAIVVLNTRSGRKLICYRW